MFILLCEWNEIRVDSFCLNCFSEFYIYFDFVIQVSLKSVQTCSRNLLSVQHGSQKSVFILLISKRNEIKNLLFSVDCFIEFQIALIL